jgi:hypothetical protein
MDRQQPMNYANLQEFKNDLSTSEPSQLAEKWIQSEKPHAFTDVNSYCSFTQKIKSDWPESDLIQLAGSGNWRYSLNPKNPFREFNLKSDIDVIVISQVYFHETWQELRQLHRRKWYQWGQTTRDQVMRTGQNVYCGFLSPKHIPDTSNRKRFDFLKKCNTYSSAHVGYREVNLMFFKSIEDTIDYYIRSIRLAQRSA